MEVKRPGFSRIGAAKAANRRDAWSRYLISPVCRASESNAWAAMALPEARAPS